MCYYYRAIALVIVLFLQIILLSQFIITKYGVVCIRAWVLRFYFDVLFALKSAINLIFSSLWPLWWGFCCGLYIYAHVNITWCVENGSNLTPILTQTSKFIMPMISYHSLKDGRSFWLLNVVPPSPHSLKLSDFYISDVSTKTWVLRKHPSRAAQRRMIHRYTNYKHMIGSLNNIIWHPLSSAITNRVELLIK